MTKWLRGWEFDEMEEKSSPTKKPNSYPKGFTKVQIGYEAIADDLLKKMDKKTDFADHLLFLKFSSKFGIAVGGANIMRGIVGETRSNVTESIQNLVYLRFFFGQKPGKNFHIIRQLRLQNGTRFFQMVREEKRKKWNYNPIAYLLPESFINEENRFNLFDYTSELKNSVEWQWFDNVNRFYEKTEFSYKILENGGKYYYSEFMNGNLIERIVFDEPEYWQVLKLTNEEISSFENIYAQLKNKYHRFTKERLNQIIEKLKSKYLLYANKDLTRIFSLIDSNMIK